MKKIIFFIFQICFLMNVSALESSNSVNDKMLKEIVLPQRDLDMIEETSDKISIENVSEIPKLKKIILTDNFDEKAISDKELCINNLLISSDEKEVKDILKPYYNKSITNDLVIEIRSKINDYYLKRNYPLVVVQIPEQDITEGSLSFIIVETKLGKARITCDKWSKKSTLCEWIRLKKDSPINSNSIAMDLYWLNKNPFRQATAIYSPGENPRTTDIEFNIKDRLPLRIYTGIDNTGNNVTGNNRIFAGLLTNTYKDQLLSYQYSSGSNMKKFQAHTLKYSIPLPWRNQLSFIGGYAYFDVNYKVNGLNGEFHSKGMSLQASTRYEIPFIMYKKISEINIGFDFKRTNNNVTLSNNPVFGAYANLTQLMASYNLGGNTKKFDWNFEIEGYYSPLRWISDQSNTKYTTIRAFAKNKYAYMRSASSLYCYLPKDFNISMFLRWQIANKNLLPSETFGLGGYDTVRGYKERAYNGDLAILYNVDFQTPNICFKYGKLKFLGFFDIGKAWKNHKAGEEKKSEILYSIGPGVRYFWTPYISARLDWGFKLRKTRELGSANNKLHFSIVAGY